MSSSQNRLNNRENCIDFAAQSPKNDDGNSVEDMLASVDEFIQKVYRDLSLSPPHRPSMSNSASSRPLDTSDASSSTSSPTVAIPTIAERSESTPVLSPVARRNMDAEIERINRICDNVDQNLRSVGVFMNRISTSSLAESLSNTNLADNTPPSSTTSVVIVNNASPSSAPAELRMTRLRSRRSQEAISESVIDLSNSQVDIPEISRTPISLRNDDADDDVILISANIPPVVDLCTPGGYQSRNTVNYRPLSRRRLHEDSAVNVVESSEEPPLTRRRRMRRSLDDPCLLVNETAPVSNSDDRTPFMCAVCMESCLKRQPTSTVCGHVFCRRCIAQAIRLNHKCPLCNRKLTSKETFRIYI